MRILLDENMAPRFRSQFPGHDVRSAQFMGWMQRPNGDLVTAGERHPYQLSVPLAGAQLDTDDTHLPGDCAGPDRESGAVP